MKKILKVILTYTLKPYLKYVYLKSGRAFDYDNLSIKINAGVFHPGLFYSSKLFCEFIKTLPIKGSSLLDIGSGSGILSLVAAKKGASVTAIDINQLAVDNTRENAELNQLKIVSFQSDLFCQLKQRFDYIVVNPPYYPREPLSASEQAWYCGESHEYFVKFFSQVSHYCEPNCGVYMIMSDGCNLGIIKGIASDYGFILNRVLKKKFLLEDNFIYEVRKKPQTGLLQCSI